VTPLPLRTVTDVSLTIGAFVLSFSPSATAVAFFGASMSGFAHSRIAEFRFSCEVVRSAKPSSPSMRDWNTCPGGKP
jgi:hypothetical protein